MLKPSEERTGIGSWAPVTTSEGKLDPWLSPWFSYELTRTDPWIFEKGDQPSLIISTLEALASKFSWRRMTKVQVVPTWTDNRLNGSALNKLLSTKFPPSAVVMELSCYLKRMTAKVSRRITRQMPWQMVPRALGWEILPTALSLGRQMEEDTGKARARGVSTHRGRKLRRRKQEDKMRARDPW